MLDNIIIGEGIKAIDDIHENEKYIEFLNLRYEFMLQMNECAFCPAFRICLAKFPLGEFVSEFPTQAASINTKTK